MKKDKKRGTGMSVRAWLGLMGAIVICEVAGLTSALFTTDAIPAWYATLSKPMLAPPNWIFAPVWTALYLLMGVAAFLVAKQGIKNQRVRIALTLFTAQLILNFFWSIIFFKFQEPGLALLEILCLWLAIAWTIVAFAKISKIAAWLLVPYLLWVSFATYLNYAIWLLNS